MTPIKQLRSCATDTCRRKLRSHNTGDHCGWCKQRTGLYMRNFYRHKIKRCASTACPNMTRYTYCYAHAHMHRSFRWFEGCLTDAMMLQNEYGHLTAQIWIDRMCSQGILRDSAHRNWHRFTQALRVFHVKYIRNHRYELRIIK